MDFFCEAKLLNLSQTDEDVRGDANNILVSSTVSIPKGYFDHPSTCSAFEAFVSLTQNIGQQKICDTQLLISDDTSRVLNNQK